MSFSWRPWRVPRARIILAVALTLIMAVSGSFIHSATADTDNEAGKPSPCRPPEGPVGPPKPTTISTIEQAYYCVFDRYYSGSTLDSRSVLSAAFTGLSHELQRRGVDQSVATMPALTGNRKSDWEAFSETYRQITRHLPDTPGLRQAVAAATMDAMVASLHDNHAGWQRSVPPPDDVGEKLYGLGIDGLSGQQGHVSPQVDPAATPPLFIVTVLPDSPAAREGLRAGDVIESVNGATPFLDGVLSAGALNLISQKYPTNEDVRLTLRRPATGRTWTVTIRPAWFELPPSEVSAELLDDDIAYVTLPGFFPGAADQVIEAVERLGRERALRGLILDVRGNGGGAPDEVARLVAAFAHGKNTGYLCTIDDSCTAMPTDDSVPLLNLPLVALTNRNCGSACDHFAAAVKDLGIGQLVGTRTAGDISGPAAGYVLSDNSSLRLPERHYLAPDREIIDEIGVAPDHYQPITARDLSTGKDPNITKAIALLAD